MIRPALTSDIDQIYEIEQQSFINQWTMSKRVIKYNLKNIICYILDDKVVGYILLHKHKQRKHIRLYSIAILKAYRSKGISKLLLEYTISNYKNIRLEVNIYNTKAINLYFKYNFKIVKVNSSTSGTRSEAANNTYSMIKDTL